MEKVWNSQLLPIFTWLVVSTPLKNMSSSVGMIIFPIYGKIKFMFQATNQLLFPIGFGPSHHPNPIPHITRRPHLDNEHTAVGRFSEVSPASFCDQKPMACGISSATLRIQLIVK